MAEGDDAPWRAPGAVERALGLPPGGPRLGYAVPEGIWIPGPPARVRAELEGWERLGEHPARPKILATHAEGLLFEPLGEAPADPVAPVLTWPDGPPQEVMGRVGELLRALPGQVDPARALTRLGLKRGAVDRLLATPLRGVTRLGPSLGGAVGPWLREAAGGRVVGLRGARALREGWRAVDLVAASWFADEELAEAHAQGLDAEEADRAWQLTRLRLALEELVLGDDPRAARWAEESVEALTRPVARVNVSLVGGPSWLSPGLWLPPDGLVSPARARAVSHLIHGVSVGGSPVQVDIRPPLRVGRRPPPREPLAVRRRRLFSRWDDGVQVDEEGLYSATPEALADRLVRGLRGVVIDGTCGVGAITLALARRPEVTQIIAVDLNAGRLALARHNLGVYGLAAKVRLVCADAREVIADMPADGLVLDPPWGGPGYDRDAVRAEALGMDLLGALRHAPEDVVLKLPRSFVLESLPGVWAPEPMVDERGVLKLLAARSPGLAARLG
ncbi:trimethylguanosine synthase [Myxococcota bacterium]|nr:trimethylguanosine synthase [Myxococcota bacterium]